MEAAGLHVRLKQSLELLRLASRRATSPRRPPYQPSPRPESVELARAHFWQEQSLATSIQNSSEISKRRTKRKKRDFQNSPRSSESNETKDVIETKNPAARVARSISSSLRNRFRRAFSKPSIELPPQHLDATRAHFTDGVFGEVATNAFDSYVQDQLNNPRRASLYEDPWHETINDKDLHKLSTIRSVNNSSGSLSASSKSRVTSWTNTTTTDSLHDTPLERKRLSVIQEDGGPHQPSSSAGTHLGGVSIFRRPLPYTVGQHPDPQRLYSALLRRMNQESDERAALLQQELDHQHVEEHEPSNDRHTVQHNTTRAVSESNTLNVSSRIDTSDLDTGPTEKLRSSGCRSRYVFDINASDESIYSRRMDGTVDLPSNYATNTSKYILPEQINDAQDHRTQMHEWKDEGNPFKESVVTLNTADVLPITSCEGEVPHYGFPNDRNTAHVRQNLARNAQYCIDSHENPGKFQSDSNDVLLKPACHVREDAQIDVGYSGSFPGAAQQLSQTVAPVVQRKLSKRDENYGLRTLTPSSGLPDQLLVAKRRFPLLNVKQVSKNSTPMPSRSNSLTRSQSGLLQQSASSNPAAPSMTVPSHDKGSKIVTSLRKISPENVANALKAKASTALMNHRKQGKENRPAIEFPVAKEDEDNGQPVSTPGPGYLALRSGNNNSDERSMRRNNKDLGTESPTNLIKATLSARLSRPFNMDTPEMNRPFDSIYLGKREMGFNDTAGGRLSVARTNGQGQNASYKAQASCERDPGGYGGLGPSPFESQTPTEHEEDTALPHIPTPEDKQKMKVGGMLGATLSTKRMVSNFLRSRRKGGNSTEDGANATHEEDVEAETPTKSSPLFI